MIHDFSLLQEEHLVFLAVVVATAALALTWMVTAIAIQCRRWRQSQQALAFKREMIERGLSVDQIQSLLAAAPSSPFSRALTAGVDAAATLLLAFGGLLRRVITACQWGSVKRRRQELEFKARLIEHGLSVDQIQQLYLTQPPSWPARLVAAMQSALVQACAACRKFGQSLRPVPIG